MDILYQVIIENQKIRTDLLKWKMIISATLASVGIGIDPLLKTSVLPTPDIVLCCIPFVAAFVDLLCSHLSLRVQVIGKFVRLTTSDTDEDQYLHHYENFVDLMRHLKTAGRNVNVFGLEYQAMYTSSFLLSAFVIIYGTLVLFRAGRFGLDAVMHAALFWTTGAIGWVLILFIWRGYQRRYHIINSITKDMLDNQI